mgnify:FL=1
MDMRLIRSIVTIFAIAFVIKACGPDTNVNRLLFVQSDDEERIDSLLAEAQLLYDRGEYEKSLTLTEKIVSISNDNEAGIQLKSFNELALAGFNVFDMIGKIIQQSIDNKKNGTTNSGTSDLLGNLSELLEIDDSDFEILATKNESSNDLLKDYTVYVPNFPGSHTNADSPRSKVAILNWVSKAIETICPLISDDLKNSAETSDRYQCESSQGSSELSAQSNFVYFIGHLIEVMIFNLEIGRAHV